MWGEIYVIKERDNVVYVGETYWLIRRVRDHIRCSKSKTSSTPLYEYIRYRGGWEAGGFSIESIDEVYVKSKEELRALEMKYIKYYSEKYILLNREVSRYMFMWWTQDDYKNNLQYETIIKYITTKNNKKIKFKFRKYNKFYFEKSRFENELSILNNYHNICSNLDFDKGKANIKLDSFLLNYYLENKIKK